MATVNFLYRSTKPNASLTLRLLFRYNEKDYIIGANSKYEIYKKNELIINPELNAKYYWENLHFKSIFPKYKDIDKINEVEEIKAKQREVNGELNKLANFVLVEFDKYKPEEINKEWLNETIEEYYLPKQATDNIPRTLEDYFEYYFKEKKLKKNSVKNLTTVKNKVTGLSNGKKILIENVNNLFRKKYKEKYSNYSENTINDDLRRIKTICYHARNNGLNVNDEVSQWKIEVEKTIFTFLTPEEIERIQNLMGLPEYLDNARDWLVISCYTGQRVSDFMRFDKSMLRIEKNKNNKEVSLIEFSQVKTGIMLTIPLHQEVLKILSKRNGEFPRPINDQKYNEYIKEIAKKADIKDLIKGSKLNPETKRKETGIYEKWELITSHVGRRSFATNNFGKIPTRLLMSATGHTSEKMFLKYIGKSQTDQAKELADYF